MRNRELERQLQSIRSLFERTRNACGDDIEMMSHWARYLCVLCAGFLENALVAVYIDFCRSAASPPVAQFATGALEQISNPKTQRFLDTAGRFRSDWKEALERFVDEEGRREAIDSIMANRHLIAHGRRSDITVARVSGYFAKSIGVVEFIEAQCR
jgi:hypothetical protein